MKKIFIHQLFSNFATKIEKGEKVPGKIKIKGVRQNFRFRQDFRFGIWRWGTDLKMEKGARQNKIVSK